MLCWWTRVMSLGAMGRQAGLAEKVTKTVGTPMRGFGVVLMSVQEIRAIDLEHRRDNDVWVVSGYLPGVTTRGRGGGPVNKR